MPWWSWLITALCMFIFQWHPMQDEIRRNPDSESLKAVRYGLILAGVLALIEAIIRFAR